MSSSPESPSRPRGSIDVEESDVFACLADGDRRRLLGALYDRAPDPLTERALATRLASGCREGSNDRESSEELQQLATKIHHSCVPKLEAAGLIENDSERNAVRLAEHPAFEDEGVVGAIRGEADADADSLDALFRALADSRRRTTLDVLSHQFGPIHTETLAREIGARDRGTSESAVPVEDARRILVSLHHTHLPVLSEAGVIARDADEGTVAYEGHPELRVPWMHSVLGPTFRSSLTGESDPDGMGEIEGREEVVSFGQSLCDRADEELFCMFTDTDLLEAGCLTRIRDASRVRGADVYLGTRDPTVREYIEENAPEVVLWEPETNWLNVPVAGNRVGRLLLADREAVMLGTLGEERGRECREEQAVVGEDADNALVVMVAQLLSPYLERIDERPSDVESTLPF